ncbi:RHS repeat-associated core domain-containing protein [Clostridium sp. Marseille-QA1073]
MIDKRKRIIAVLLTFIMVFSYSQEVLAMTSKYIKISPNLISSLATMIKEASNDKENNKDREKELELKKIEENKKLIEEQKLQNELLMKNSREESLIEELERDPLTSKNEIFNSPEIKDIEEISPYLIRIRWQESIDFDYELEINGTIVQVGKKDFYFHKGVVPEENYTYRLRYKNNDLYSEWSEKKSFKTTKPEVEENLNSDEIYNENINIENNETIVEEEKSELKKDEHKELDEKKVLDENKEPGEKEETKTEDIKKELSDTSLNSHEKPINSKNIKLYAAPNEGSSHESPEVEVVLFGKNGQKAYSVDGIMGFQEGGQIEKVNLRLSPKTLKNYPGMGIEYQVYYNERWSEWKENNELAGTDGYPIKAIRVKLSGNNYGYQIKYWLLSDTTKYGEPEYMTNGELSGDETGSGAIALSLKFFRETRRVITEDETWKAGEVIKISEVIEIAENATVTIEEGTKIEFVQDNSGSELDSTSGIEVKGKLISKGSSTNNKEITFIDKRTDTDISEHFGIRVKPTGTLDASYTNFYVERQNVRAYSSKRFLDIEGGLSLENSKLYDKSKYKDSEVVGGKYTGITIKGDKDINLKNNEFYDFESGIVLSNSLGAVLIEGNILDRNAINGIHISEVNNKSQSSKTMKISTNTIKNSSTAINIMQKHQILSVNTGRKIEVDNNIIENNSGSGINIAANYLSNILLTKNTIKNNKMSDANIVRNGIGAAIKVDITSIKENNTDLFKTINPKDSTNVISGNTIDGILIDGALNINTTISKGKYNYIVNNVLAVNRKKSVKIAEGTKINAIGDIKVLGSLSLEGKSTDKVVITSLNAEGKTIAGKPNPDYVGHISIKNVTDGFFKGILVYAGGNFVSENSVIKYGGQSTADKTISLLENAGTTVLKNTQLCYSGGSSSLVKNLKTMHINDSTLQTTDDYGLINYSNEMTITNSKILNAKSGIITTDSIKAFVVEINNIKEDGIYHFVSDNKNLSTNIDLERVKIENCKSGVSIYNKNASLLLYNDSQISNFKEYGVYVSSNNIKDINIYGVTITGNKSIDNESQNGIYILGNSKVIISGSKISNCKYNGVMANTNRLLEIYSSIITSCGKGIDINNGQTKIQYNKIHNNEYGVWSNSKIKSAAITYNSFKNNSGIGLTSIERIIDATHNYWGASDGPYVYESNKVQGSGDKISNNSTVKYEPIFSEDITESMDNLIGIGSGGTNYEDFKKPVNKFITDYQYQIKKLLGQEGQTGITGNYSKTFEDIKIKLPSLEVNLERTYNSNESTSKGSLGNGWRLSFESEIKDIEAKYEVKGKTITLPDGSVQSFKEENGKYIPIDNRNELIKNSDGTHELIGRDQSRYGYTASGLLSFIKDKNDNALRIHYNSDKTVKKIDNLLGRIYEFEYKDGNLIKVSENVNGTIKRVVQYNYNSNKLLSSVVDFNGSTLYEYKYDANKKLSEVIEAGKTIETITYFDSTDNKGKVKEKTDIYGNKSTYNYDNKNRVLEIKDSKGRITKQLYNISLFLAAETDPEGRITIMDYDANDEGVSEVEEVVKKFDKLGNVTSYTRDKKGNIIKEINPDLTVTEREYDEKNNIVKEVIKEADMTVVRNISYEYDKEKKNLINKIEKINPNDNSGEAITTYEYYDANDPINDGCKLKGLIKSIKNPEGGVEVYTYDKYGNKKSITNPENKTIENTYNDLGFMVKSESAKGVEKEFTYDNKGNLERTIVKGGEETTRIVYDSLGRKVKEVSPNLYNASLDNIDSHAYNGDHGVRYTYHNNGNIKTIIDEENNQTTYDYDIYGNKIYEKLPSGVIYIYEYDSVNRPIKKYIKESEDVNAVLLEEYEYEIVNTVKGIGIKKAIKTYFDENNYIKTYVITDYKDREVKVINSDGTAYAKSYDALGNIAYERDARGNTSYYKYNGLNKISSRYEAFEDEDGDIKYIYKGFEYDKNGNLIKETMGKDLVFSGEIPEEIFEKNYEYFKDGMLKSEYDSEGRGKEYEYDKDNNLSKEFSYIENEGDFIIIGYSNNKLGLPSKKYEYIKKCDIYGNDISDKTLMDIMTEYEYDKNGNLISETSASGNKITYSYDNKNRKISESRTLIDENGNKVEAAKHITYNSLDKVESETDYNGNVNRYSYDSKGMLLSETNTKGEITNYTYDLMGRLIEKTTPKDKISNSKTRYTYDSRGRVVAEEKLMGSEYIVIKAYMYDACDNVIKEVDGLAYKNAEGESKEEKIRNAYGKEFRYNLGNMLQEELDPVSKENGLEFSKKYKYDGLKNLIKETNAKGNSIVYSYNGVGNLLSKKSISNTLEEKELEKNTYNLKGNLTSKIDGNGNVVSNIEYNIFGKIRKAVINGDSSIEENVVLYQYDLDGNNVYRKDSTGKINIMTYDTEGRLLSNSQSKEDNSEIITTKTSYDKNGNKRFEVDGKGNVTEYTYDGLNRVISKSISDGNTDNSSTSYETRYEYDEDGNITKEIDWLGNVKSNTYDALGRLIERKDGLGNIIERLEYKENNLQYKSYDALNNINTFEYDKANRLISTTDAAGNITKQAYDENGNIESKIDGNGNITEFRYDELNRLTEVIDANRNITSYTYDNNGNKTSQTDGKGNKTTYEYNIANKLTKIIDPNGIDVDNEFNSKIESYTYYCDGNIKSKKDKNGKITSYSYDIHGRKILETIEDTNISYTYDNNGKQLTVADNKGTIKREYDFLNRTISKEVPEFGKSTFIYDSLEGLPSGERAEVTTDPKGNTVKKVYDSANRLKTVISNGEITSYEYYENGNKKCTIYPDGSKEEYDYLRNNRLKTLVNTKKAGEVLESFSYTYDNTGNMIGKHDEKGTTLYTYDNLNRLSSVKEPTGKITSYTYDLAGNRETEKIVDKDLTLLNRYIYNGQNRLLSIISSQNDIVVSEKYFKYDNNGNQIAEKTTNIEPSELLIGARIISSLNEEHIDYKYDLFNQLIEVVKDNKTIAKNGYDAEGLRVLKDIEGNITNYLYEGDNVILETDKDGQELARNVWGTSLISRTINEKDSDITAYYMYNGHSDVTKLLNSNGDILASYYYDAFGNILEETGSIDNPYRYSGYEYDSETGKYYLKARMYDPVTARFMQEDTYRGKDEDPLSLNLYTYCHNNPIEYYDPTGHIAWHVIGGVIGAVAGAGINLVADYMDDGKINRGVKSYLKSAGVGALIGSTLGYGYGAYVMNAGMNAVSMIAGMTAFGIADSLIGDIIYNGGDINVPKAISEGVKYGAAEAGSQVFQYGMEKIVIPKAKMVFKEVTASFKKQAVQEAKAAIKNVSKLVSAVKSNSRNMFGGLKNSAPKAPRSLPNGNISQGAKTPKLKMNLQLFGNKNGSSNVGGNAIKGADNPKLPSETKVPKIGKQPGPTIDRNTGKEVGRFIGDEKGNIMIEPKGGYTVPGKDPVDTHTLYPNKSNYQRLNPNGHPKDSTPHGHGHLEGTGPNMKGQGPSIDVNGNQVDLWNPAAHWKINK